MTIEVEPPLGECVPRRRKLWFLYVFVAFLAVHKVIVWKLFKSLSMFIHNYIYICVLFFGHVLFDVVDGC